MGPEGLLVLVALGLLATIVAGAIAGIVAAVRTSHHREELNKLRHSLRLLRDRVVDAENELKAVWRRTGGTETRAPGAGGEAAPAPEAAGAPEEITPVEAAKLLGLTPDEAAALVEAEAPPEAPARDAPSAAGASPHAVSSGEGVDAPRAEPDMTAKEALPTVAAGPVGDPAEASPMGARPAVPPPLPTRAASDVRPAAPAGPEARPLPEVERLRHGFRERKRAALERIAAPGGPASPVAGGPAAEAREVPARSAEPAPRASRDQEWWKRFEETVGKRWTTWVGAVALILAAGLFVRLAFQRGWLGTGGLIVLGLLAGAGLVAAGVYFLAKGMGALGQGIAGTGVALLYVTCYAGFGRYWGLPQFAVFALLALVTAGAMVLAVSCDALPVAFLALLGGFLTPVLVSTGVDARDSLFAYLLVLDVGVLGVAAFRRWRAMDVTAFLGTWAYFAGWHWKFFAHGAEAGTCVWLGAFFVVFLLQPFVYHMRLKVPVTGERFVSSIANAAVAFTYSYLILRPYPMALGAVALAMSAAYLALGAATRKRLAEDVRAVFGFIALAVLFLTIAVPIALDFQAVTVMWAVEAPVLLFLAYRYDYFPVRVGAAAPLALAAGRVLVSHTPFHAAPFVPFANTQFGTAIVVAVAGGAYALIHRRYSGTGRPTDRFLKSVTGLASAFLALVVLHVEVWEWMSLSARSGYARWATALVWVAGAAAFLAAGMRVPSLTARVSGFVPVAVATVLMGWDYACRETWHYSRMLANGRFLAGAATVLAVLGYAFAYRRSREACGAREKAIAAPLYGLGILLALLLASFETWQHLTEHGHGYAANVVLVFVWSAGAGIYFLSGTRLLSAPVCDAGLAALAVSAIAGAVGFGEMTLGGRAVFVNWHFVSCATVPAMLFAYMPLAGLVRKAKGLDAAPLRPPAAGTAVLVALLLASAEVYIWFDARSATHLGRAALPAIWSVGAGAFLWLGVRFGSEALRIAGKAALAVAALAALVAYAGHYPSDAAVCVNWRFAAVVGVAAAAVAYGAALRRIVPPRSGNEWSASLALHGAAILFLAVLLSWEVWRGLDARGGAYAARCLFPLVWAAAAAACLVSGARLWSPRLRAAGVAALAIAALFVIASYAAGVDGRYALYANGRFASAAVVVAAAFVTAWAVRRMRPRSTSRAAVPAGPREARFAKILYGTVAGSVLLLLSVETYGFFRAQPGAAGAGSRVAANASLSIVWSVCAMAGLAVGFWRRVRALRVSALALFGLTAVKIVVIDMAKVGGVPRIATLVVMGFLLLGASYLYARLEKWLEPAPGGPDARADGSGAGDGAADGISGETPADERRGPEAGAALEEEVAPEAGPRTGRATGASPDGSGAAERAPETKRATGVSSEDGSAPEPAPGAAPDAPVPADDESGQGAVPGAPKRSGDAKRSKRKKKAGDGRKTKKKSR